MRRKFPVAGSMVLLAALAAGGPVRAAEPTPIEKAAQTKAEREKELADIHAMMEKVKADRGRIMKDVDAIRSDREKLIAESIAVASRIRSMESTIAETETRLADLNAGEATIRASLNERRAVIADVLAALQRMGRRPPPALIVESRDFVASLRSATLLATIVPELREAAAVLAVDLDRLDRVRHTALRERDQLALEKAKIEQDRIRLDALAEARREELKAAEVNIDAEKLRAAALARQAFDLENLIGRMDTEIEAAKKAQELAHTSVEQRQGQSHERRQIMSALGNPGRMEPAIAFADAKGQVPLPVTGLKIRELPLADGGSGKDSGLYLKTRPLAQVIAPADGWVVYSGPFRKYGHVLILNVGAKHLILLAGMERVSVDPGQFVVKGEPVGVMGQAAQQATQVMTGRTEPVLYIEFRKDGAAIDSSAWWQSQPSPDPDDQKARG